MLKSPIPWNLREVLAVHLLRLLIGFFLVSSVYADWFGSAQIAVEITDRILIIALVWLVIHKHGAKMAEWGFNIRHFVRNGAIGIAAGLGLFFISIFSERIYTAVFLLSPSQHPLISRIENASSWGELAVPLLLASLAAPVAEETLYRLFTFNALKERYGLWWGALLSAAVFALFHFNIYWLSEIVVVGFGLALLYYWTGSLISAIVAHSFVNSAKIALFFLGIPLL